MRVKSNLCHILFEQAHVVPQAVGEGGTKEPLAEQLTPDVSRFKICGGVMLYSVAGMHKLLI